METENQNYLFKTLIEGIFKDNFPLNQDDYIPYYNAFVVNMALSRYIDTIMYAATMNQNAHLPKQMQYDYLFHSVRKHKRPFHAWDKQTKNTDVEMLKEYYHISIPKAKELLKVLTTEQLNIIKNRTEKGG